MHFIYIGFMICLGFTLFGIVSGCVGALLGLAYIVVTSKTFWQLMGLVGMFGLVMWGLSAHNESEALAQVSAYYTNHRLEDWSGKESLATQRHRLANEAMIGSDCGTVIVKWATPKDTFGQAQTAALRFCHPDKSYVDWNDPKDGPVPVAADYQPYATPIKPAPAPAALTSQKDDYTKLFNLIDKVKQDEQKEQAAYLAKYHRQLKSVAGSGVFTYAGKGWQLVTNSDSNKAWFTRGHDVELLTYVGVSKPDNGPSDPCSYYENSSHDRLCVKATGGASDEYGFITTVVYRGHTYHGIVQ